MLGSDLQGYPPRMRLQRQLQRSYTVCFLIFIIVSNRKRLSFFALTIFKLLKYCVQGRRFNLTLESSIWSFISSQQSHLLWVTVTLYVKNIIETTNNHSLSNSSHLSTSSTSLFITHLTSPHLIKPLFTNIHSLLIHSLLLQPNINFVPE